MNNFPLSKSNNLVVQELEKEILIYDLNINKAFCLNETSAIVFQLCNGSNSVAGIADLVSKKLKTLVSEDFVWLAIEELKKNNLLENKDQLNNHFKGLSRREIVKRVGLATMIALPIISSVVAPSAAMAQSGAAGVTKVFGACNTTADCISGLTCINCIQVNFNCGGPTCCSNSDPSIAFDSGGNRCSDGQPACDVFASQYCCSGTGYLFPVNHCGADPFLCVCN